MSENLADFRLDLFFRPIGMLAAQEGGFVPARRPIETVRRAPALRGGHCAQVSDLLRAGFFIRQHQTTYVVVLFLAKRSACYMNEHLLLIQRLS